MKFKTLNQVNGGATLAIGASLLEIMCGVHVLGLQRMLSVRNTMRSLVGW